MRSNFDAKSFGKIRGRRHPRVGGRTSGRMKYRTNGWRGCRMTNTCVPTSLSATSAWKLRTASSAKSTELKTDRIKCLKSMKLRRIKMLSSPKNMCLDLESRLKLNATFFFLSLSLVKLKPNQVKAQDNNTRTRTNALKATFIQTRATAGSLRLQRNVF